MILQIAVVDFSGVDVAQPINVQMTNSASSARNSVFTPPGGAYANPSAVATGFANNLVAAGAVFGQAVGNIAVVVISHPEEATFAFTAQAGTVPANIENAQQLICRAPWVPAAPLLPLVGAYQTKMPIFTVASPA